MKRQMTRVIGTAATLASVAATALAAPVSVDQAARAAETFIVSRYPAAGAQAVRTATRYGVSSLAVRQVNALAEAGDTIGFVADLEPGGYVLLRGDDEAPPVKLYSEAGVFTNLPPGFLRIITLELQQDLAVLAALRANGASANPRDSAQWRILTDPANHAAELRQNTVTASNSCFLTSKWHQNWPYNQYCPQANGGFTEAHSNAVAGCGAVAMAQLLHYYGKPKQIGFVPSAGLVAPGGTTCGCALAVCMAT